MKKCNSLDKLIKKTINANAKASFKLYFNL